MPHPPGPATSEPDQQAIAILRALSLDQVHAASSGHLGLPLGAAPIVHTLYRHFLVSDPGTPDWPDRDRFVLSAGHGSALLYAVLHLAGYDLTTDDLRAFRQWGSRTPGHPESELTPGVEATTGPLGQGVANAVGMAIAETALAARFNTADASLVDHYTYTLVSDGDLMEGVALEAIALAGKLRLGKLIAFYDDNDVVIDGAASQTHSADGVCVAAEAQGWQLIGPVDGNDVDALAAAITLARAEAERPSLIRVQTVIGYGLPSAGTAASHSGAPTTEDVAATKSNLGIPGHQPFAVPDDVRAHWAAFAARGRAARQAWEARLATVRAERPELAAAFDAAMAGDVGPALEALDTLTPPADPEPVRQSSATALEAVAKATGFVLGGAGDLACSTLAFVSDGGWYGADDRGGSNIAFGVREHAMGAVGNGIALHGGLLPFASTFLVFAGYEANPLRMAALQGLQVLHLFSHDSITVGEDGPTHQPVETLPLLRATPNTLVLRPADAVETAAAWRLALRHEHGPSVFALSRTPVPQLDHSRQVGSPEQGGYLLEPADAPDVVLLSTGAEVSLCVEAARLLAADGVTAAVASLPSLETFAAQPADYRASVLPADVPRLAVEAAHPQPWWRLVGDRGDVLGMETFGASAPPDVLRERFGFTPESIAARARALLSR